MTTPGVALPARNLVFTHMSETTTPPTDPTFPPAPHCVMDLSYIAFFVILDFLPELLPVP